ncbi:hypothetical protein GGP94_003162 [Salinibacter ruber]|uniref:phage tail protein n=1 Tax=Salinibacter ruber TaxID=146919 RepID=UPI0021699B04|nr:phage tail protein [Salinibacter ruber]MCS4162714.1 hypothetical protein [Salinibacter ruber]
MAAPTDQVPGVRLLTKTNGTLVGGQTDATLEVTSNLQEVEDKSAGFFNRSIPGFDEWSLSADNAHTGTGGEHVVGKNDSVVAELTAHGGSTAETVQGLQELDMSLEADLEEVQTFQTASWKEYRVTGQSLDLSLTADYFDPAAANGAAHDLVLAAQENGETLQLSLTFGALTISGDIRPSDWTLSAPGDNSIATFEPSFRHEGAITHSGSVDGGLDAALDAYFNRNTVTSLIEYQEDGTAVTGATKYEGDGFVSSIELSGTQGETLDFNYEIQGSGPLSRATQA